MTHTREHRSLLASAEKRLLIAMRRLPRRLSSDPLTLLGLVAMPAAGLAFAWLDAVARRRAHPRARGGAAAMTSRWMRLQELAIRTSLAGWAWRQRPRLPPAPALVLAL